MKTYIKNVVVGIVATVAVLVVLGAIIIAI